MLAATAVAVECGVPLAAIADRASRLHAAPHRGEVIRLSKGIVVIDDSYNASPAATRRALDVLRTAETAGRRIAVLGEMLELGDRAMELHDGVGRAAAAARLDLLIAVGGDAANALAGAAVSGGLARERVQHVAKSGRCGRRRRGARPARRRHPREGIARRTHGPGRGPSEGGVRLMLYYLLFKVLFTLGPRFSVLNVTRYITFRTAAASLSALAISLLLGPWLVRKLREFQIGQIIRQEGPTSHKPKAGTPTMGGLLILTAALVPTLLWADLTNVYVWIVVMTTAGFGAIGFADDYLKLVRRSHHGLRPRYKFGWQLVVGTSVGILLLALQRKGLYDTRLVFPFFKRLVPDLGVWYLPFAVFVLVAESNAVNLTDGLDGLAISIFAIAVTAYTALTYVVGQPRARRLPAPRALSADGGADGVLRRRWWGPPSGFSGTTRTPPKSSWATWARWRSAPLSPPSRFSSSRNCCCSSWAACS